MTPAVRPWYLGARDSQKTFWTDIYIFNTGQKPGISRATPILDRDGKFLGVFGMDIGIDALSVEESTPPDMATAMVSECSIQCQRLLLALSLWLLAFCEIQHRLSSRGPYRAPPPISPPLVLARAVRPAAVEVTALTSLARGNHLAVKESQPNNAGNGDTAS